MSKRKITDYQTQLAKLGLYTGVIDGISGPKTIEAIRSFQRLHGAEVTGIFQPAQARQLLGATLPTRQADVHRPFPHDDTTSLIAYYGQPGDTSKHTQITLPFAMKLAWLDPQDPNANVKKITLHEKCAPAFAAFFEDILNHYGVDEIRRLYLDQYGGSYSNRAIRGGSRPSTHAFAAAIDYAPQYNQLRWSRAKALFARPEYVPVMSAAARHGLTNLGVVEDFDYMHFQAAWR